MNESIDEIIARVELSAEIARIALSCPGCRKDVRKLIENSKINPLRGHSSLQPTNERNTGVSIVQENNTTQYK